MPPLIVDVAQNHRAALLARETAAMQAQAQAWLRVEQALQAQTDALALELARTPGSATMGQLSRSRRYAALMEQTRDELRRYEAYIEPRIRDGQRAMIASAIDHSAALIGATATEAGINVQFNRLPVDAVEAMVGMAGDGSPLRAVLADASRVGPDALAQELVNGIALGRNPIEVARLALRRGLGQSFTRMQAIARTEQLRVYRTTSLQSYQASRVVIAYKRLSARDRRTCPACLFADGQQYPIEHGFDEHVQGRCTMIPVLANVPPVQYEDGQTWFTRQDEAMQRAILGRGRFDIWQRGDVSLSDMVQRVDNPTWGGSLQPMRVGDLAAGRRGAAFVSVPGRAPVPVAPPAPRVVEWQPAMSRADADLWAKDSVVKADTYHVTPGVKNERAIKANGFDLSKKKFGRMWGDGVYVGTDEATAAQYRRWTGQSARTLPIRIDVRKPAIFDAKFGNFTHEDVIREVLNTDRATARRLWRKSGDLTSILQDNGFDALDLRNVSEQAGGNQMVIFDTKKVVVIND